MSRNDSHPLSPNLEYLDEDASDKLDADKFEVTINSADASTATVVKAKTADKKIYVTSWFVSTDTELNFILQSDAGSPVIHLQKTYIGANQSVGFAYHLQTPLELATNVDLDILASIAGNISVTVTGYVQ